MAVVIVVWQRLGYEHAGPAVEIGFLTLLVLIVLGRLWVRAAVPPLRMIIVFIKRNVRFLRPDLYEVILRRNEGEGKTLADTIRTIIDAWHSVVTGITDQHTRSLMAKFLLRYAEEESNAIQGKASGRRSMQFVVTRFLTYSAAVTTLVNEARASYEGKTIVCFTALPMRLSRWFNYRVRGSHDDLKSLSAHVEWEAYKKELRALAVTDGVLLVRCVVAVRTELDPIFDFAINTQDEMNEEFKYKILLKGTNKHSNWSDVEPFNGHEIATLIGDFKRANTEQARKTSATIQEWYGSKELTYVILPDAEGDLAPLDGYQWLSVARVFALSAHESPRHCKYWCFDKSGIDNWFDRADEHERMPADFFAIGIKEPNTNESVEPNWRFCLAGSVGQEQERVTLEVFAADRSSRSPRYDNFLEYVHRLWENAQSHELQSGEDAEL